MKVLVAIKSVIDHNITVQIRDDNLGIKTDNVKISANPFDEIALEAAIQLKEKGIISEIIVISCGFNCKAILQNALAMGADRAIFVYSNIDLEPLPVAKIIKKIVQKEKPQIVFLGKQSIDKDSCQTGQILAGLLNWSQATFASCIDFIDNRLLVNTEVDFGSKLVSVKLPTVITADLNLNEPRYISLQNLIKSKKKKIELIDLEEISNEITSRIVVLNIEEAKKNKKTLFFSDIDILIDKLKNELI
ncbi:MAG: electron transfer flavoprotein subunit beta/FixA family protein [Candidatus Kinetoplastibacterium crithidii]|nr:MAG: electron transfer flavoprotein subunit beta/FixA family protein [Candidatus Kinetoplastibacterium crithidii]